MPYDKNLAVALGKLVDAAYNQFNGVPNWQPPGYAIVTTFVAVEPWKAAGPAFQLPLNLSQFGFPLPQMGTPLKPVPFGYIATQNGETYVVIRGTLTPLEWLADFTIVQTPFKPNFGRTTLGFKGVYDQFGATIIQTVQHLQQQGQANKVYVTGHSLGAAVAHLAAVDIYDQLKITPESYTFSGPRTGDPDFANAYAAAGITTYRIFNTEDIVPTVPLAAVELVASKLGLTSNTQVEMVMHLLLAKFASAGLFQHVGIPTAVTFQKGDIADNHNLTNTYNAL